MTESKRTKGQEEFEDTKGSNQNPYIGEEQTTHLMFRGLASNAV
jgi:hypothetical protein